MGLRINPSVLKVCTYGLMHFVVAICVAYALTRDIRVALAVGIVEPLVQTFAFAIHEQVWRRFGLGDLQHSTCGHSVMLGANGEGRLFSEHRGEDAASREGNS